MNTSQVTTGSEVPKTREEQVGPPLFSVVLCTYNREALLRRAIDSVLAQDLPNWALVVVDDGSEDNTFSLVRDYIVEGWPVRYLFHRNCGLALSRNAGMQCATGRFVTFLDSDDYYEPNHLRARRDELAHNPRTKLLHGGYRIVGDPFVADKNCPSRQIHIDNCIVDATFVARRRDLLAIGGFPVLPYAAGNALFHRLQRIGWLQRRVTARTYVYDRTAADSICTQRGREARASRVPVPAAASSAAAAR